MMATRQKLRIERRTAYGWQTAELTSEQVAEMSGITRKTAQRYIRAPDKVPPPVRELLEIKALGLLPDPAFDGWVVRDGGITSPLNRTYKPGELDTINWLYDRANTIERRNTALSAKIDLLAKSVDHWRQVAGYTAAANDD